MRRVNSNTLRSLAAAVVQQEMDFPKLQSRSGTGFPPPHKTQLPPRLYSLSNSSSLNFKQASSGRGSWWAIVGVLILLSVLFYLLSLARGVQFSARFHASRNRGYGIIIDGGSTGSRIYVFEFVNEGRIPLISFTGKDAPSLKTKPGLSAFASTPNRAGDSLLELLNFAKQKVPEVHRSGTKIHLMATAGLRRLDSETQEMILNSCRRVLRFSGFRFQDDWASVITAFYSVEKGVVVDPCTPRGYTLGQEELLRLTSGQVRREGQKLSAVHSMGNFSECRNAALTLLRKGQDECLYQHCRIGSTFIPELHGKFFATENFFYTSQFFGLVPKASLSDIETAGKNYCEEDWAKLQEKHHGIEKEDLLKYCFSSAYIVALLNDSLGIAMNDERIRFTNQVGSVPLDWALGAFILHTVEDLPPAQPVWILGEDSLTCFSLLAILTLLGLAAWSVSRWRRPHLKTIYDLEKGRYITTAARAHR